MGLLDAPAKNPTSIARRAVAGLQTAFNDQTPGDQTWVFMGDSTGDATNEWIYLTAQGLADRYKQASPAKQLGVNYYGWTGTNWSATPTTIQSATAGYATLTFRNASVAGTSFEYMLGRVLPKLRDLDPEVVFINSGHNDSTLVGKDFETRYMTLLTNLFRVAPTAKIVLCTQNPQVSPAARAGSYQAQRRASILTLAQRYGFDVLDAYQAFADTGNPSAYILAADGVHPTTSGATNGSRLWADKALAQLAYVKDAVPFMQDRGVFTKDRENLLLNGDFREWTTEPGIDGTPANWVTTGLNPVTEPDNAIVTKDTANKELGYPWGVKIKTASNAYQSGSPFIRQALSNYTNYANRWVTVWARVRVSKDMTTNGASYNSRGSWALSTSYAVNDVVTTNSGQNSWLCVSAHTSASSGSFPGEGNQWNAIPNVRCARVKIQDGATSTTSQFLNELAFDQGGYLDLVLRHRVAASPARLEVQVYADTNGGTTATGTTGYPSGISEITVQRITMCEGLDPLIIHSDDTAPSIPDWPSLTWSTDANYTVLAGSSVYVRQTGTLTAARTLTLPAASAVPAGSEVIVQAGSSVTGTNTITVQRAGSDTINGSTSSVVMGAAYGWRRFISDGSSAWTFDAGVLRASNNLSDLGNAATARTNLGAEATANKNQANGYAGLDANSKIASSQLPAIAVNDTFVVASQAAMLALTAEVGDVAVRTDVSKSFILTASPASTLGNWQELLTPPDTVTSVAGKTGVVTLANTDITGLGSLATKNTVTSTDLAAQSVSGTSSGTSGVIAQSGVYDNNLVATGVTAGTYPKVTVTSKGRVTAGTSTIVNSDIDASAAIADSKLNLTTTVTGTAISSTNKIVDAAAIQSGIDRPNAMILYPWWLWGSGTGTTPAADQARGTRFVATRDFTVTKIAFYITGAATNNDNIQFAILNSSCNTVHASTTAGAVGITSTGLKTATLTSPSSYKLTQGTTYYVAYAYDYTSGTGATILGYGGASGSAQLFGNTIGQSDSVLATGTGSTSLTTTTFSGTQSSAFMPFFILLDN